MQGEILSPLNPLKGDCIPLTPCFGAGIVLFVEKRELIRVPRKRDKSVTVRVTEEEYKLYKLLQAESGLSSNEYGLRCLLNKKIIVLDGFKDLAEQIKKVGVNVNQIAKGVNSGVGVSKVIISEVQRELNEVWRSLSVFLQKVR